MTDDVQWLLPACNAAAAGAAAQCRDGYHGNGACHCDASYTGAECEFCSNSQVYGPNCTTGEYDSNQTQHSDTANLSQQPGWSRQRLWPRHCSRLNKKLS